jgi:nitrous oxidase accessory protein NosD
LLVALVAVLGLMAVSAGAASATGKHKSRTWVVKPGHSIQKVVDKAKSGDTIKLKRGVFYEAVCVVGKGLTIVGAGQGKTVIRPPKKKQFMPTKCWKTAAEVSAFAFQGPDSRVKVSNLTTADHPVFGIVGFGATHGIQVSYHTGLRHGEYGAAAFESRGIVFTNNTELGAGGEAGLYVGDTANAKAYVADNVMKGWTFGMLMRDSRNGLLKDNLMQANCIGAFVLDTGPNGPRNNAGGAWTLVDNRVINNNRFCPPSPPVPPLSGDGIVVAGADHVVVKDNLIVGHKATKPGAIRSAGLALISGAPFGSDAPDHVTVVDNTFKRNVLDIFWDKTGKHIAFRDNECKTSDPAWICKHSHK